MIHGLLSRSALTLIASAVAIGCSDAPPREPAICARWNTEIIPLLIGDSTRVTAGTLEGSDCPGSAPLTSVQWRSSDSTIAAIRPDGMVRGIASGSVRLRGALGRDTVWLDAFVLPRNWSARLEPADTTVTLGDSVTYRMVVRDSLGRPQAPVPYSIYSPEWLLRGSNRERIAKRLTEEISRQGVIGPIVLHTINAGTRVLTGKIGRQKVQATLTVRPR